MVTIYLDIDGVLNPFDYPPAELPWPDYKEHVVYAGGTRFHLLLSQMMATALTELDAEIVWTTTWQEDAETVGREIGIEGRDYLELGRTWKLGAIMNDLHDNPGPYVWIDDDEVDAYSKDDLSRVHDFPQLAIRPYPNVGLTPGDIESIQEFIRSNT